MGTGFDFLGMRRVAQGCLVLVVAILIGVAGCQQPGTNGDNNDNGTEDGWILNPANGHYYKLTISGIWPVALADSVANGGYLVTINDANENDWLVETFAGLNGAGNECWIGLAYDALNNNAWDWSNPDDLDYTNWADGEPVDGDGRATILNMVDGTWDTALMTSGNLFGIIERDTADDSNIDTNGTDNNDDNGTNDQNAEGAMALRVDHVGSVVMTGPLQDLVVDFDGAGTLVVEPNETTVFDMEYTKSVEFTNKPTDEGEITVYDPNEFVLTGTLTWEVTYLVDENGSCLRLSAYINETNTQQVDLTVVSPDGTLPLEPANYTTFGGDIGGDFFPNDFSGEDRCAAPYEWDYLSEDNSDPSSSYTITAHVTITPIDFEDLAG